MGVIEVPVGSIGAMGGGQRHAQITALSLDEMLAAIRHAALSGQETFTLVSHSFELINRRKLAANRVVRHRFTGLVKALEAMPGVTTGTYVDMCSRLPLTDPRKLTVPTIILRGEYDGIAGMDDLIDFYKLLPNMNKQFSVMRGISHASFQQKNHLMVYQILHSFFSQPEPSYRG